MPRRAKCARITGRFIIVSALLVAGGLICTPVILAWPPDFRTDEAIFVAHFRSNDDKVFTVWQTTAFDDFYQTNFSVADDQGSPIRNFVIDPDDIKWWSCRIRVDKDKILVYYAGSVRLIYDVTSEIAYLPDKKSTSTFYDLGGRHAIEVAKFSENR